MTNNFRSGFIAIVGEPNVGKSTLLNTLMQRKIAIVTNKPQTTRNKIQGVITGEDYQIVFLDSPGIHKSKNELDRQLNRTALQSTKGVEGILGLVNSNQTPNMTHDYIYKALVERQIPIFLILTKVDLIDEISLKQITDEGSKKFNFQEIIPLSTLKNINVNYLLKTVIDILPMGPKYFADHVSQEQTQDFLVKEIIREKVLLLAHQEVPHGVAILINEMRRDSKRKLIYVNGNIIVERDSQKGILIGHKGKMIKDVSSQARMELEDLFGDQFYLDLNVKVIKKWRDDPNILTRLGYGKR